jgi:hypothetical protein
LIFSIQKKTPLILILRKAITACDSIRLLYIGNILEKGLSMDCYSSNHQGHGLASIIVLTIYEDYGFKEIASKLKILSLPAVVTYMELGFQSTLLDGKHEER